MEKYNESNDCVEKAFDDLFFYSAIEREKITKDEKYKKISMDCNNLYKELNEKLEKEDKIRLNKLKEIQNNLINLRLEECYKKGLCDSVEVLKYLKVI